jgi:hypothetical protein
MSPSCPHVSQRQVHLRLAHRHQLRQHQPAQEVQGSNVDTFDKIRHYHSTEIIFGITNIYDESANIGNDSSQLS